MFLNHSRYGNAQGFSPGNTQSFFPGVRPRPVSTPPGIIEHIVRQGDRLDLLAAYYYNDARLWWRIADANPEFIFAGLMVAPEMAGGSLAIPKAKD
ncbi:MAG: hypothetical protein HUN04_16560 [Desulfobacter sp.]|nr:MAG: hypothetical protein HUN04_16560 [Desulfobacter sp.]